jgi:hypothetical protein
MPRARHDFRLSSTDFDKSQHAMDTPDWPDEKIHTIALRYIRKHCLKESEWRFTVLDALAQRLERIVQLEVGERAVVACFIDAQRWYVMTSRRVFGVLQGSRFTCAPLDVTRWQWGDFKHMGRSEVETATLALKDGTHIRVPYETGHAAMAPIYYERFWGIKYPVLDKLE